MKQPVDCSEIALPSVSNAMPEPSTTADSPDRRLAIRRLGRYGAYVAPVVVAMLAPDAARAQVQSGDI